MKRKTGQDRTITTKWRPATQAVRGGTARSEWGETSEAMFLTSGYAYDCAGDAAARFAGEQVGMTLRCSKALKPAAPWHQAWRR
jgi:O-succinylhomoserine sulfhydrylase